MVLINNTGAQLAFDKQLAQWPKSHPLFWRQMKLGAITHLLGPSKPANSSDSQDYFRNHYRSDADPLVFDGGTNGYLYQLMPLMHNVIPILNAIDLGCGKGALFHFLRAQKISISKYTGLDYSLPSETLNSEAIICEVDLRNDQSTQFLEDRNTLFAVNTLCYFENVVDIHILRIAGKSLGNKLMVLEPWPGWFWDRYFDGIWPVYRSPHILIETLSKMGWSPIELVQFYYGRIVRRFFLPLSYAIVFTT